MSPAVADLFPPLPTRTPDYVLYYHQWPVGDHPIAMLSLLVLGGCHRFSVITTSREFALWSGFAQMPTPFHRKSSVDQIRQRFDADVERFSDVETGQSATMDAVLAMELVTQAAVVATVPINDVLDIGCGAGNYTIKLREATGHDFHVDLVDLSEAMLTRASERVSAANGGSIRTFAADFRNVELEDSSYDVVLAAAVLHHLRDDDDWHNVFSKIFSLLRPGGSVWIADMVAHEIDAVQAMMWARYGDYLVSLGDENYRDEVFDYIDREDSPRPVTFQLDLLKSVGFTVVDVLHKNSAFAAFGAVKPKRVS